VLDEPLPYPDPQLTDGRIGLRKWHETDIECIRLAGTDQRIPKGTTVPAIFTPAGGLAFIHRQWSRADNGEGVSQAIVDVDSDRAMGLMWVALRPQRQVGGLGYWVVPPDRGHGVATAAVRLIVPWALKALDLRRLEAWVAPDNLPSQRVLHSAGFLQEGRLRNFLTDEDGSSDALVFSVIAPKL
jgi:[ribosomal protein S5]-alanine N-acetyltransferase